METEEIKGVEIFSTGNWNGDSYSDSDLDAIVAGFNETKAQLKPYLKLGHGEAQKLLKADELPSAGFITNVYRSGQKVLADFSNIPKKIYELMKKKAYSRVSVELYKDMKIGEKVHAWALKAVALLGGETPAVHSLDDIIALYGEVFVPTVFSKEVPIRTVEFNFDDLLAKQKQEGFKMDLETLTKQNQELDGKVKSLSEENANLKSSLEAIGKDLETQKSETAKIKEERRLSEISTSVKELVTAKKITPARGEKLKSILEALPTEKKFSFGGKEFSSVGAFVLEFASEEQVQLPVEEKTEMGKEAGKDIDTKAKEYAAKHQVSYKDALIAVANEGK